MRFAAIPLTVLALSAGASTLGAQQNWFSEDFDTFPPAGWSVADNGVGGWTDGSAFTSQLYIIPEMAWHDEYVGQADSTLTSPSIDLSGAGSTVWLHWTDMLRFQTRLANHPSSTGNGTCELELSVDGGSTWINIWNSTRETGQMKSQHVDLSPVSGQPSVILRWRYTGDQAHHWGIDEVRVDESPYGVVRTRVNPANGLEYVAFFSGDIAWGRAAAASIGGQRMSVIDAAENQWIWQEFSKWNAATSSSPRFIQRQVQYGGTDEVVEGVWQWEDGRPWTYQNWGAGQPDNQTNNSPNGEDYVALNSGNGTWKDIWEGDGGMVIVRLEGPRMTVTGSCPGALTVDMSGLTPGGLVFVGYGTTPGSFVLPQSACAGATLGILAPSVLVQGVADANGDYGFTGNAPPFACGNVHLQAMDYSSCELTNVVAL